VSLERPLDEKPAKTSERPPFPQSNLFQFPAQVWADSETDLYFPFTHVLSRIPQPRARTCQDRWLTGIRLQRSLLFPFVRELDFHEPLYGARDPKLEHRPFEQDLSDVTEFPALALGNAFQFPA
jgi:hypothetical protein